MSKIYLDNFTITCNIAFNSYLHNLLIGKTRDVSDHSYKIFFNKAFFSLLPYAIDWGVLFSSSLSHFYLFHFYILFLFSRKKMLLTKIIWDTRKKKLCKKNENRKEEIIESEQKELKVASNSSSNKGKRRKEGKKNFPMANKIQITQNKKEKLSHGKSRKIHFIRS